MDASELAALRKLLGLTQQELADRIGRNRVTVANWERGEKPVPPEDAAAIEALAGEAGKGPEDVAEVIAYPDLVKPAFDPEKAGLKPLVKPPGMIERDFEKEPLRPGWQRVPGADWKVVHGSIPDPIPYAPPEWAKKRGAMSANGRVYDLWTGREMKRPGGGGL